eukprot:4333560-Amphidinium_carterae.2
MAAALAITKGKMSDFYTDQNPVTLVLQLSDHEAYLMYSDGAAQPPLAGVPLQIFGHRPHRTVSAQTRLCLGAYSTSATDEVEHQLRLMQPIGDELNLAAHFVYCTACGSYAEKAVSRQVFATLALLIFKRELSSIHAFC